MTRSVELIEVLRKISSGGRMTSTALLSGRGEAPQYGLQYLRSVTGELGSCVGDVEKE